jgi:FixJ family two-component response regulator
MATSAKRSPTCCPKAGTAQDGASVAESLIQPAARSSTCGIVHDLMMPTTGGWQFREKMKHATRRVSPALLTAEGDVEQCAAQPTR